MITHERYRPLFLQILRSVAAGTLSFMLAFCVLLPSKALTEERFWSDFSTGLAIGGFDPVSFFADTRPQRGLPEHEYVWQGAFWQFANEGNMAAFMKNPEIYAPQFGGHAATALVHGYRTEGNPQNWLIDGGKLYLFYSRKGRSEWLDMDAKEREQASENWKKMTRG